MPREADEQFRVGRVFSGIPGEYDEIDRWQLGITDTKALAHDALQAVPVGCMAYFLA